MSQADYVAKVYRNAAGEWEFRIVALNGEIVAEGEAYTRRTACIERVRAVFPDAPIVVEGERD